MSNQQNVAEMKVAEPTQAEKEAEKARLKQEYKNWLESLTSEEKADYYQRGLIDGGYRKKSRKGKKSKRRNTRRRRGRRSRKHRMR